MNECGGRSLGKPLCNAALNKALRMPGGGGGMEVPAQEGAQSECGERQEEEQDARRRARQPGDSSSPPPPPPPLPSPPLSSSNSSASPTLGRSGADPRPQPTPLCCGRPLAKCARGWGGWVSQYLLSSQDRSSGREGAQKWQVSPARAAIPSASGSAPRPRSPRAEPAARTPGGAAAAAAGPGAALLMAAAAARNLRDPRAAAAAAAAGRPPSLDNPKHKQNLPPRRLPGPPHPRLRPPPRRRRPSRSRSRSSSSRCRH
ncbi:zinc finger protein ZIC 5-like [Muntiacus reevesi]|uniref:zinc finger protein ZIC 5-like n=1 Tax=Muntiacus reevesi TaxID=9886 RepID=UPI0033071281